MRKRFVILIVLTFLLGIVSINAVDLDSKNKKAIKTAPPSPKISVAERHTELAKRRKQVADAMADNSMLILFSADSKVYSNDVDFYYRQENNLYYLTQLKQNGITLVIIKSGDNVQETLFLPKRNPQFETWNGRMYSNEDATELSGITNIADARYMRDFINALKSKEAFTSKDDKLSISNMPENVYIIQGNPKEYGKENEFAKELNGSYEVNNASTIFAKLRLVKSPYEIKMMQHSIDITNEALMRSMGMVGRANYEYEVQAEVEYTFRRRNADYWGYPSIVGCGPNATTLHYIESQGEVKKGDLMLMDVGAEYEHYTADVTRTFPVNGKFTKEQAEIYQIVYDAQEAAAKELKPGAPYSAASNAAQKVIVDGLFKLGLITDKNSGQEQIWYMHGWGHWLGMNVHDVGNYGTLQEGMITTNEPGIYIRENALDYLPDTPESNKFKEKVRPIYEKYKNIGVRIEDDMLITKTGVEWMTKDLPRTITDIEAFMAKASKEMSAYALVKKPFDATFAIQDFGTHSMSFNDQYALLNSKDYLNGKTVRSGWVNNSKTIEVHSH